MLFDACLVNKCNLRMENYCSSGLGETS